MKQQPKLLKEGLRTNDLEGLVSNSFSVDRFKSKMGSDADTVVLGFSVAEKYPAIDLMEFIEKGYNFVLDSDMSTGEEHDGRYQVFVEIERTPNLSKQLKELFGGISQLTNCWDWRFRYQKSKSSVEFNEDTVRQNIPLTPQAYESKLIEIKNSDLREFFDQGSAEVTLDSNNTITFKRPYAGDINAKFVAIGEYDDVKEILPGAIDLDESSQSQTLFLNKYIGNYDITKIGKKFLIRNGNQAVIIEKDKW